MRHHAPVLSCDTVIELSEIHTTKRLSCLNTLKEKGYAVHEMSLKDQWDEQDLASKRSVSSALRLSPESPQTLNLGKCSSLTLRDPGNHGQNDIHKVPEV